LSARRLDISDWLEAIKPQLLTHAAGFVVGLILMVRGGLGGIYYSDRFSRRKNSRPVQIGRILYLFVGFFLVSVEVLYFLFGIDWFHKSLMR
jgi:hypothetical protein